MKKKTAKARQTSLIECFNEAERPPKSKSKKHISLKELSIRLRREPDFLNSLKGIEHNV